MYTIISIVLFFIASITHNSFCFFFITISLKFGCLAVFKMISLLLWCSFMIISPDIQSSVSIPIIVIIISISFWCSYDAVFSTILSFIGIPIVIFISFWCSCTDIFSIILSSISITIVILFLYFSGVLLWLFSLLILI